MPDHNTGQHKNEVHLAGELARDPEVRNTASGKVVASFTVLTKYQQWTEYHRVTAWERLAEKVGKLSKGAFVKIVGRLQTRSWEDPKTQTKRYVTEIVAWQLVTPGKEPVTVSTTGVQVTDEDIGF
jgi:single stranded DNA-binding protein